MILIETLNLNLAPFAPFNQKQLNSMSTDDFANYKYGWQNGENKWLTIKDVINLSIFNYQYEKIPLEQNLMWIPEFYELIAIPIPSESLEINLFIIPKKINFKNLSNLKKEKYLAGLGYYIGINRAEIHCDRCEKTRTNININISHYLLENNINKKNIKNYNLIIEGHGLSKTDTDGNYKIYSHDEILKDGKFALVLDDDDIITQRKFKFEEKYIHTKLVKSVLSKLEKLGYTITNKNDWKEILITVNKFELEWAMGLEELIKMKHLDDIVKNKPNSLDSEEKITIIKDKIKLNQLNKTKLNINYKTIGFNDHKKKNIKKCFKEWSRAIKAKNIRIRFTDITNSSETDIVTDILLSFIPIDGEYKICGKTWKNETSDVIHIDIDSDESYSKTKGLFKLVVKHELGHVFGLSHSQNKQSIMFPFINSLDKKVNEEDINNILS